VLKEKVNPQDASGAVVIRGSGLSERVDMHGRFVVECFDGLGRLKWRETIENLVTTVGKNDLLDKYLGLAVATAIHMGLKGTGAAAVGDTMSSHAGWLEVGGANAPTYTGNRPVPAYAAASGGSKTTSAAVSFAITGSGTIAGCFIVMSGSATKDNTTGVLYSAGDFTGGSKIVSNGDTLNVTYTASA